MILRRATRVLSLEEWIYAFVVDSFLLSSCNPGFKYAGVNFMHRIESERTVASVVAQYL